MGRKVRRGDKILAEMYKSHDVAAGKTETSDTMVGGVKTEPQTSDAVGISSAPPPKQFIPPKPACERVILACLIAISQAM